MKKTRRWLAMLLAVVLVSSNVIYQLGTNMSEVNRTVQRKHSNRTILLRRKHSRRRLRMHTKKTQEKPKFRR